MGNGAFTESVGLSSLVVLPCVTSKDNPPEGLQDSSSKPCPTITVAFHSSSTGGNKTLAHALKSPSERAAHLEELYCLDWGVEWSHLLGI